MFTRQKQVVGATITTDRWAHLGSKIFEELTIMGSTWGPGIYDAAAWNAVQVEEVSLLNFEEMLVEDVDIVEWDKVDDMDWGNDFELVV
jgi:hypothetical protein